MPTQPTDELARSLSARLARGDADALAALYESRFDWMVGLLARVTRRDDSFVLDCAQDAWIRIASRPVPCPDAARLDAWLRRVALSCALDRLRSDASRVLRERSSALPEAIEASIEGIESAQRALASADAESTGLLLMRYRAGMTVRQIGRAIGLGPAAAESRLRRALERVRSEQADTDAAVRASPAGRAAAVASPRGAPLDKECSQ